MDIDVERPVRMCVGCRQRTAKRELVRVSVREGAIVPDPRGIAPGRGAHLHPTTDCLNQAIRKRALPRALRVDGGADTSALVAWMEQNAR